MWSNITKTGQSWAEHKLCLKSRAVPLCQPAPDVTVAVQTKWVPKARRVSQVKPAWKAASLRDDTNTPRSALVTARLARSWLACGGWRQMENGTQRR